MLVYILVAILAMIALLAVVVAVQPADFRITRSMLIDAPAEELYPLANNPREFQRWNPFAEIDPNAKIEYSGPESGVGAAYKWSGNNQAGEGRMEIIETKEPNLVRYSLDFIRPMTASNIAEFTFEPEGNQTKASWSMSGKNGFFGKAFNLVVNCEKMVGSEFEKGLTKLKSITESTPAK